MIILARPKKTVCRDKGVRIRCTEDELNKLRNDAARRGMNVSEYIREIAKLREENRHRD